jgi:folate-binding protein YgfZ
MRFSSPLALQKSTWRAAKERSVLRMSGADRLRWLNGLVTCNVENAGKERYGLLCEKKGKIETDFHHVATPDAFYVVMPADRIDAIYSILDHHLIMEDVELERSPLAVTWHYGPVDQPIPPVRLESASTVALAAAVPLRGVGGEARLSGTLVLADVAVPGEGDALSDEEWEALRVYAGVPAFGMDFDSTMLPQEASVEQWAVAFDKGCYMGQEVIYMLENRGHARRRLVHLELEPGSASPARGAAVSDEAGAPVGEVKSAAVVAGTAHALALVKSAVAKAGATVVIDGAQAKVTGAPTPK